MSDVSRRRPCQAVYSRNPTQIESSHPQTPVSRDKQTAYGEERVGSDCESGSGVISIRPRETSRADVANPAHPCTRFENSKRRKALKHSPTQCTCRQPAWPEVADTGQKGAAGSLCQTRGPPRGACLLDLRSGSDLRPCVPPPWNFDPGLASAIATMEPHLQVDPPSCLGLDMSFTGSVGSFPPS